MADPITKEALDALDAKAKRATPGRWEFVLRKRGDGDSRSLVAAVAPGHQILTDHPGGTFPANDGELIPALVNAYPALRALITRLQDESEGRRKTLLDKSEECRREWMRAENAEAEVGLLKAEITRLRDGIKTIKRLSGFRNTLSYYMAEIYTKCSKLLTEKAP